VAELRNWLVNIEATVTASFSISGRTPEEAENEAEQNFYDEYGEDFDIEDLSSIAVPSDDDAFMEEEFFPGEEQEID